jgi:hypothetical protein
VNRREFLAASSAAGLLYGIAILHSSAQDIPSVAFFGFQLINTSIEPTSAADEQRIRMLDDLLQQQLSSSGRFHIVPIPDALQQEIVNGSGITNCNGCQREYAQKAGADSAAWGTVQKVSNLILNINLYMEDERTGQLQFAKSVRSEDCDRARGTWPTSDRDNCRVEGGQPGHRRLAYMGRGVIKKPRTAGRAGLKFGTYSKRCPYGGRPA